MATEKQIRANRENAKRSTGPKTAAGRMKSSRNAFRHGLSLKMYLDDDTPKKIGVMVRLLGCRSNGLNAARRRSGGCTRPVRRVADPGRSQPNDD